ncbi:MAG: MtaA/CmuA family methyltransferase [Desulfobacterales bacterium]|jgi:[methyl-Co(III) methanol-specific corrinoid protein]:coenzyme M methyltransferase
MNLKKRFMNRLLGNDVDMTPVGSTTTYGMVELMKKCGAARPLADRDPVAMAKLALAGLEHAGFEWVKAMGWDITAISEAFGCALGEPAIDLQYYIKTSPFKNGIERLDYPSNFLQRGRFPAYKEQFRILQAEIGADVAIFGLCEGPFTCAANLVGVEQLMKWTIKAPDKLQRVLEITKQAEIDVINFAFDYGADYYCISEPSSGPSLLSPKMWEKFVQPVITDIVGHAKGPVTLHICGNTDSIVPMMCDTGVVGISIEEKADLKQAVEIAHGKGVRVFGNVATATTLFSGTPRQCYREAWRALENGTDFLAPGCGVAPQTPLVNIRQLQSARNDYFTKT